MKLDFQISVAANSSEPDILNRKRIQDIPSYVQIAAVSLYATGSATGLEHQMFIGGRNPLERGTVSAQNRQPLIPDDFVTETVAGGGEKITIDVFNTTAGALTYFLTLYVEPQA